MVGKASTLSKNGEDAAESESEGDRIIAVGSHQQSAAPEAQASISDVSKKRTLIHALRQNRDTDPNHTPVQWVNEHCEVSNSVTYQQLWEQSNLIAQLLLENDIKKGDRVMIAYPFGVEFLSGLFGCMLAGIIPCLVYPPNFTAGKVAAKHSYQQFNNQVKDAGAKFALTTNKFKIGLNLAALAGHRTNMKWLATDKLKLFSGKSTNARPVREDIDISPEDVAFIQYSSGSTGDPKGVVLSHAAVVHNIKTLQACCTKETGSNFAVNWMPQYHDYGLICFFLGPCYTKSYPAASCSPIDFIRNPLLWADMIDKFQATSIGGPNFAYGLFAKRMKAAGRTLKNPHTVVGAGIAAEPIAPQTLQAITNDLGMHEDSINPCYGLAETCVYFTSCNGSEEIRIIDGFVSVGLLTRNERHGKFLAIAGNDGQIVNEGKVAEIYLRGPDLSLGYWGKPELNHVFHCKLSDGEEYFATGDLGMVVEGRLFVVGRSKELIIINGKNVYPTDLERTIEAEFPDHVRPGSTVAFQYSDTQVGIVMELKNEESASNPNSAMVSNLILKAHGVSAGTIYALKKGGVPKTTSGKLRRMETKVRSQNSTWSSKTVLWEWQMPTSNLPRSNRLPEVSESTAMVELSADDHKAAINNFVSLETCLASVFGRKVEMSTDWESNGLTSLMHAEIINQVQEHYLVTLPISFDTAYATPDLLKAFIEATSANAFLVELPVIEKEQTICDKSSSLSMISLAILQGFGICFLFLVLAVSVILSFYVGKQLVKYTLSSEVGSSGRMITWSWLPLVVPTFFLSLSFIAIALKWLIIGRYRSTLVAMPSVNFLRWWFIDRLMELWEFWVGIYIIDTKLIWLFYWLMGTDIHWSSQINTFLREFDLVTVGSGTMIDHQVRCRRFTPWSHIGERPSLAFRHVKIGKNCTVSGMVSPGVALGDCCKVSKFAAVSEGAQVPNGVVAKGSPAYNAGSYPSRQRPSKFEWVLDLSKLVWLGLELVHFHALLLLAQVVLNDHLPDEWRYTPLLYWVLLLTLACIFGVISSVLLKWSLVGRRQPGQESFLRRRVCYWVCDYHYRIATSSLYSIYGSSRIWNVVLLLHGMDIDMHSFSLSLFTFIPSNIDLVKVRRSFLSKCSFNISEDDKEKYDVIDSSIGYEADISGGVKVHGSVVPPRSEIRENLFGTNRDSHSKVLWVGLGRELIHLIAFIFNIACFIPAYEFFMATVYSSTNVGLALVYLTLTIGLQGLCWILAGRLIQSIVFWKGDKVVDVMYDSYVNYCWACHNWSMLFLVHGTPFAAHFFRFMGSKVKGEFWYFGLKNAYDYPMLTFEDKTLVDTSHISGHFAVYDKVTIERTSIGSGVLHPGCYTMAGSVINAAENGPWRVFLPVDRNTECPA